MKLAGNKEIQQYLIYINEIIVKRMQNIDRKTRQNGGIFISEKRCHNYAHSQEVDSDYDRNEMKAEKLQ